MAASMPTARERSKGVLLQDGRVLLGGGVWEHHAASPSFVIYDPKLDKWTPAPAPPDLLDVRGSGDEIGGGDIPWLFTMTVLKDGRVLVTGAVDYDCGRAFIFDPSEDTWRETTPLAVKMSPHTSVLLDDGRVFFAGGSTCWMPTGATAASAATQIFDPSTESWTELPPMILPRYHGTAVRLACGGVMAVGGTDRDYLGCRKNADTFDFVQNRWFLEKAIDRVCPETFNAVTLSDGRVLTTNPTYLYDPSRH